MTQFGWGAIFGAVLASAIWISALQRQQAKQAKQPPEPVVAAERRSISAEDAEIYNAHRRLFERDL